MPLEKEEQKSEKEEGDDMSKDDVRRSIEQVLGEREEKSKATGQLSKLGEKVQQVITDVADLKKLFCNPDGTVCFLTQAQLDAFMQEQDKHNKALDGKLTTVAEKVATITQPPKGGVAGLEPLEKMTDQKRDSWTEEQSLERDAEADPIFNHFNISDNDKARSVLKKQVNVDNLAKKPILRKPVLDNLTEAEGKQVMLMGCKDGKCKPWREGLEKEEGVRIYKLDPKTKRWEWVDQPPKPDMGMV